MEFRILGPLEVVSEDGLLALGGPKPRAALALLLARAGVVVPAERLIGAMWPERAPSSAAKNLQTYIWSLRRAFAQVDAAPRIAARSPGYVITLAPGELDLAVFTALAAEGRELLGANPAAAASKLREALALWRGAALADIAPRVPELEIEAAQLAEQRQRVLEERFEADLAVGRHVALVSELSAAVAENPARERLSGLLMVALYRCGRQAHALATFQATRRFLIEELGVEPGRDLRLLHQRILTADPNLEVTPVAPVEIRATPAELPHNVVGFVGRKEELADLHRMRRETTDAALGILMVVGVGGVGKTALATRFAHQVAAEFDDGQLYLNLRGFDPEQPPVPPDEALRHLLRGLGVDTRSMPSSLDDLAPLFRSRLAGKKLLILLDNAASAEQVRPLLPGEPRCLVVVTSRRRLSGLVSRDGARRLGLDVLPQDDAAEVLSHVLGRERVDAEPVAAAEIARQCAGLPLALRIAADRASVVPAAPLTSLARRLAAERERLDLLSIPGDDSTAVRMAFSLSYRALGAEEARLFRLLSLHAGDEISETAVAATVGLPTASARRLLDVLAGAHLLEYAAPDRVRFHDLIRLYAWELSRSEDAEADRLSAQRRLVNWYLHTADNAGRTLIPARNRPHLVAPSDCAPLSLATREEAVTWFDAEERNIAALIRQAADQLPSIVWKIPLAIWDFFYLRKPRSPDWPYLHEIGLAAAKEAGDHQAEAWVRASLGYLQWELGEPGKAEDQFRQAIGLWEPLGLNDGLGVAFVGLGLCHRSFGRFRDANACCDRAAEVFHAIGDHFGEGFALVGLAAGYRGQDRFEDAIARLERALEIFERIDDPWGKATALTDVGKTYRSLGRSRDAIDYLNEALEVYRVLGYRRREATVLRLLGETHLAAGEPDSARVLFTEALRICEEISDPHAHIVRELVAALSR